MPACRRVYRKSYRFTYSTAEIFLLVTDIGLPDINGLSMSHESLSVIPHLKVIFMTGYLEHAEEQLRNTWALLLKPFGLSTLCDTVWGLLMHGYGCMPDNREDAVKSS